MEAITVKVTGELVTPDRLVVIFVIPAAIPVANPPGEVIVASFVAPLAQAT